MSHIDTLQVYQDYIKSGYTEDQALCAVNNLEKSFDGVVTTESLAIALKGLEYDLKIFFTWEIGAVLVVSFILPKIGKKCGLFQ